MLNWLKSPSVPSEFDLEGYHYYAEYTPDIALLEQKMTHLLFVYDRMQERHSDHCLISEYCCPMGKAFTKKNFVMFKRNRGIESYPVALEGSEELPSKAPIKGELYLIQTPRFIELDTYKRNGVQFVRKRVALTFPHRIIKQTKEEQFLSELLYQDLWAFMYVGEPSFWRQVIDDERYIFKEVSTFKPNVLAYDQYYEFTKLEYHR